MNSVSLPEQARAALKGAAREKSGALATAMEARDAARARLAVVEAAAEAARTETERDLSATRKRAEELGDALHAAQVMPPDSPLPDKGRSVMQYLYSFLRTPGCVMHAAKHTSPPWWIQTWEAKSRCLEDLKSA